MLLKSSKIGNVVTSAAVKALEFMRDTIYQYSDMVSI
jgi:hypothetical protein